MFMFVCDVCFSASGHASMRVFLHVCMCVYKYGEERNLVGVCVCLRSVPKRDARESGV